LPRAIGWRSISLINSKSNKTVYSPLLSKHIIWPFRVSILLVIFWIWDSCHSFKANLINLSFYFKTNPPHPSIHNQDHLISHKLVVVWNISPTFLSAPLPWAAPIDIWLPLSTPILRENYYYIKKLYYLNNKDLKSNIIILQIIFIKIHNLWVLMWNREKIHK
jgi:hypothetical protein